LYTDVFAVYTQGDKELGQTYTFETHKGGPPSDEENTVPPENLDTVVEHLTAVQTNPMVKEQASYGKPFFNLVRGISQLSEVYDQQRQDSDRTAPQTPSTTTYKF
jgi:hypothetical protein